MGKRVLNLVNKGKVLGTNILGDILANLFIDIVILTVEYIIVQQMKSIPQERKT